MSKKHVKALVTGGAGFVGSHLCEELLSRGFSVTAIDNLATGKSSNLDAVRKNKSFCFIRGSIMNESLMKRLIRASDIVYHLAAAVGVKYILDHPVGSILTNIEGTQTVLKLASAAGKKVLITSTSEVYGKHVCAPFKETDDRILGSTSVSRWSYADAKAADEFLAFAYAKECHLPVVIVRLFNTVGPRQISRYGMVLPRFIQAALKNKPIEVYGNGQQIRSFIHVKDATRIIGDLSLSRKAEGGIFNVGNDRPVTIQELAVTIKRMTRSRSHIVHISYEKAFRKNYADFEEIECRIPDLTKLKTVIRYMPRYSTDAIINDTILFFSSSRQTA
jgi:UDP-glucose 4-epimerase